MGCLKAQFAFDHVSFGVESNEDLWQLKDKLEASDIWVSEVIDHGFIHSIYTFDPNHIPIEFSVSVSAINLRENPQMKDSHPSPAALDGTEPMEKNWPRVSAPTPKEEHQVIPGEGRVFVKKKAWHF